MNSQHIRDEIRALLDESIARQGFELVAVEWVGSQGAPVLRLSIDNEKGVTAQDCAQVSSYVSPILDEADPIDRGYHLEVSSPGIMRPVQRVQDFERFLGYAVKLRLIEGHPRRRFTGTLGPIEGDELTVRVDGQEHRIRLDTIERAHLVLDLDEYKQLDGGQNHDDQ